LTDAMRAAVLYEVGGLPVPSEFADPPPLEGYETAEVLLAGLNPVDLHIAAGTFFPVEVPCVVGREGVARLADDRRVYFDATAPRFGSMAELAPVDPAHSFTVPDGVDEGLAVACGIAGLAAWLALEWRARLQPGESVLVLGASGVVGQIGVQAAKLLDAGRVTAAARSRDVLERLLGRGADGIVVLGGDDDREQLREAAGRHGYDVILDPVYGAPLEAALPACAQGARVVSVGSSAGDRATIGFRELYSRVHFGHDNRQAPYEVRRDAYERLTAHAAASEVVVDVERVPLEQVADAWRRQAAGPHHKLTIVP
jgi:NADPH:quinone reductase-like Zn-dependent oxidoreductase